MAITAKFLKDIMTEARPIVERQMNDAKLIAGFRDVVAAAGGDWGALKALIKAHVEDENDETGDGKRVQKVRDRADDTSAYADLLDLPNMNENNFSADQPKATSYAEAKGVDPKLIETVVKGVQTDIGRAALITALDIMIEREEKDETNSPSGNHSATSMESSHVDSSAQRASSAVEFGATNSPATATVSVQSHDEAVVSAPVGSASDEISATNSIQAGPHLSGVPGGERSTPSIDKGGAKMDEVTASPGRSDDKSGIHHAKSKQAAPNSDDVPAFLREPVNERCLKQGACKYARSPHKVTCSECGSAFMKRRAA